MNIIEERRGHLLSLLNPPQHCLGHRPNNPLPSYKKAHKRHTGTHEQTSAYLGIPGTPHTAHPFAVRIKYPVEDRVLPLVKLEFPHFACAHPYSVVQLQSNFIKSIMQKPGPIKNSSTLIQNCKCSRLLACQSVVHFLPFQISNASSISLLSRINVRELIYLVSSYFIAKIRHRMEALLLLVGLDVFLLSCFLPCHRVYGPHSSFCLHLHGLVRFRGLR